MSWLDILKINRKGPPRENPISLDEELILPKEDNNPGSLSGFTVSGQPTNMAIPSSTASYTLNLAPREPGPSFIPTEEQPNEEWVRQGKFLLTNMTVIVCQDWLKCPKCEKLFQSYAVIIAAQNSGKYMNYYASTHTHQTAPIISGIEDCPDCINKRYKSNNIRELQHEIGDLMDKIKTKK